MTNIETLNLGQDSAGTSRLRAALARRTEGRGVTLLAVVVIAALVLEPLVFTAYQVTLGRVALIGLVALGLTAVILMGELDLSVASTLAVSGVVMALVPSFTLGIIAALCAGLLIGVVNAFLVVKVGI
ncbi:MAG: ABC transporter permease, partial [Nocardioides sp.]